ncbi:hypothetical protein [Halobacillus shinanisalinarum]|nr:hypothetical protein [Halobacillus shinanisalinarum]
MDTNKLYKNLENEFKQRLKRELKEVEKELIKWMVEQTLLYKSQQ